MMKRLWKAAATLGTVGLTLIGGQFAVAENAPKGSGTAEVIGTVLSITGTDLDDDSAVARISRNRLLVRLNRTFIRFPAEGITEIEFFGGEGDDSFTNNTPLPVTAEGGPGDDSLKTNLGIGVLYGGTGDDDLFGGPGDDILCGGSDNDFIFGNNGNDFISGDASGPADEEDDEMDRIIEMAATGITDAVLVGDEAFAKGQFVQIGVSSKGTLGADGNQLPADYVDVVADGRAGFAGLFGFIADSGKDGFDDGGYDGDFFAPGTAEEGFTIEIGGVNYSNNSRTASDFDIPGMITGVSNSSRSEITWLGSINGLGIERNIRVYPNGLFIELEVILTNESEMTLPAVYFMNNVDPDNDQTLNGEFATFNQIISQGDEDPDNISLVTAQQDASGAAMSGGTEETGSAISLVSFDPRARVTFGGFSNRDASEVYDADGLSGTVGDFGSDDFAISLAFNVGDMEPGESTTLTYYYSLDPTGIDISDISDINDMETECNDGGQPGDDIIFGNNGDDTIITDAGNDTVYGGNGSDMIDSGDGNDRVFGNAGRDTIDTGLGDDQAFGGSGMDTIRAGGGNDTINGGGQNDTLRGEGGDDRILGGGGNDLLEGGMGTDTLIGGGGNDTEID